MLFAVVVASCLWCFGDPIPNGVNITLQDGGAEITVAGKLFTRLVTKDVRKPIFWPILGIDGEMMTQNGPGDHIHHRSLWFTHGKVNGFDFWSESPKSGRTIVTKILPPKSGPELGELEFDVDWIAVTGEKVCSDHRKVRVYQHPRNRMMDFEITFSATNKEITFGDDKEGTFGVRVPATMQVDQKKGSPAGGTLINAEGLKNAAVWGKKSAWCDYYGPVGGKIVGIAIFDHPGNLRHPTTWHARTYGLYCANPFGLSHFQGKGFNGSTTIKKGESLTFRYRLVFHPGTSEQAQIKKLYEEYANLKN